MLGGIKPMSQNPHWPLSSLGEAPFADPWIEQKAIVGNEKVGLQLSVLSQPPGALKNCSAKYLGEVTVSSPEPGALGLSSADPGNGSEAGKSRECRP